MSKCHQTAANAASLLVSVAAAKLAADSSLCSAFFLGKLAALNLGFQLKKKKKKG